MTPTLRHAWNDFTFMCMTYRNLVVASRIKCVRLWMNKSHYITHEQIMSYLNGSVWGIESHKIRMFVDTWVSLHHTRMCHVACECVIVHQWNWEMCEMTHLCRKISIRHRWMTHITHEWVVSNTRDRVVSVVSCMNSWWHMNKICNMTYVRLKTIDSTSMDESHMNESCRIRMSRGHTFHLVCHDTFICDMNNFYM